MTHTKADIIRVLQGAMPKSMAEDAIDLVVRFIAGLPAGDRLELRGLGTFERKPVAPTNKRNPITNKPVTVEPYSIVRFKPSKTLKQ